MTDKFQLNSREKKWIKALQDKYAATVVEDERIVVPDFGTNLMK